MERSSNRLRTSTSSERFRIVAPLGCGGMGTVYEAIDAWRNARVALKFVRPHRRHQRDVLRQLEQEATAMLLSANPRVCAVYGLDEYEGRPCIVMQRLVGQTLQARMSEGPFETGELLAIAVQIADALAAVHRAGLVHHDVKPTNIFLTTTGSVKLLDFGVATWRGMNHLDTASGQRGRQDVRGTTNYIAPERILRRPADHRSDLFSLGAVIYEMATGRRAFGGSTPAEVLFSVLDDNPAPVRRLMPSRPAALDRLVQRLLAKNPKLRHPSAAAVCRAIARIQVGKSIPAPNRVQRLLFRGGTRHASNEDGYSRVQ